MKIIYIHQFFKTPREPGSTRSYFIIQELIKNGHSVTVIGAKKEGQQEPVVRKEIDGIDVISVSNFYSGRLSIKERFWSFFRFMLKATQIILRQKDVDLVIATSTPLTVGVPALIYNKIKGVPFLFEVRDLWPAVPIEMGALKNPVFRYFALWLEKIIYKNALHIIALSPGMKEGVVKVSGRSNNVSMVPNMAKIDIFYPREENQSLIKEIGLNTDSLKIIHFGAMGMVNGLDYFVDAASIALNSLNANVEFILIGDGSQKEKYLERKKQENLTNLFILDKKPLASVADLVNICDVSYVGVSVYPILEMNSANKFFDSLSAGKPIIVNFKGWLKDIVEDHECGAYVDPMNPINFAKLLKDWSQNRSVLKAMGVNSRRLAEEKYDKSILCKHFAETVNNLKLNI